MYQSIKSPVNCNHCGARLSCGIAEWHFVCSSCGLEQSTLIRKINETSVMDESARAAALKPLRQKNFTTLLEWLSKVAPFPSPERPRLLEVGCAHGWFIDQAKTVYDVQGIEPDEAIANEAGIKHVHVRRGFFPDVLDDNDNFELIVFNDVLEHIPDTSSILAHCHKHLTESGYVVINAPSSEGIFYRVSKWLARIGFPKTFERMWQVGLPSPHLYYFNTKVIAGFAEANGLVLQNVTALPSVTSDGLTQRILYASPSSLLKAKLLALTIKGLMPLINMAKPDIQVWLLKKSSRQKKIN